MQTYEEIFKLKSFPSRLYNIVGIIGLLSMTIQTGGMKNTLIIN